MTGLQEKRKGEGGGKGKKKILKFKEDRGFEKGGREIEWKGLKEKKKETRRSKK